MSSVKRIKIAFILNDLLVGGAQVVVLGIAKNLDNKTYEPVIYYLYDYEGKRKTLKQEFQNSGITCTPVGATQGILGLWRAVWVCMNQLRDANIDIVHAHLPDAVFVGGCAAVFTHTRFIIHQHQTQAFHSWKMRVMYVLLRPFAALTICYSPSVEKESFNDVHILTNPPSVIKFRSCTIPNGVDIVGVDLAIKTVERQKKREELGIPGNTLLICSVARFVEWKGHRLLLEAFARIAPLFPNTHLLIAGDGPLREELQIRASTLGLGERVHMPGARTDVYEILAVSDIFSLAFTYPEGMNAEAIGVAGFEAMAAGLPVVVSDYTGIHDLIRDGHTGFMVPPHNVSALAATLEKLLYDPMLRKQVGERAKMHIHDRLRWGAIAPVYEGVYSNIL